MGLSIDGVVSFEAPDWSASVSCPHFSLTAPKLSRADGLHMLAGEDGEIGVSFDKHSSRHFFFLGKALSVPTFSLHFKVCLHFFCCYPPVPNMFFFYIQLDASSRFEFNKEKGLLALLDKSGKARLVYSAPAIRIAAGISTVPELSWDPSSGSLSIPLPTPSFPLVIAFGIGAKIPDAKGGFHFGLPSFKFGSKGEIEEESSSSESDDEGGKKKRGLDINIKAPKIGFGIGGKKDKKDKKDKKGGFEVEPPTFAVGGAVDVGGQVKVDKPSLPVEASAQVPHAGGKFKVYCGFRLFLFR